MPNPLLVGASLLAFAWLAARQAPGEPGGAILGLASPVAGSTVQPLEPRAPAAPQEDANSGSSSARTGTDPWTVRGRVWRGFGLAPLPAVRLVGRVYAGGKARGTPLFSSSFQADEHGEFAFAPPVPQGLFTVEVRGDTPGYTGRASSAWYLPGDPAPADWSLFLYSEDVSVRGLVRDETGAPVADAFVAFTLGEEERAVRSASDGTFRLACSSARPPRSICAWRDGHSPACARLGPEVRLHGFVRDARGAPLSGAEIAVHFQAPPPREPTSSSGELVIAHDYPIPGGPWPRTSTDANGRYELSGVHPLATALVLQARASGSRPVERSFSGQEGFTHDLDLTLADGVPLTGHVRAAGVAVEGAWLSLGDYVHEIGDVEAWSDAEGRFMLAHVPAGRQRLWVWRRGFAQLARSLDVTAGMPALELELAPGHVVGGIVLGPDGAPKA
ncbi:MAG: carboxypeptidase regulatory-like domain-containing protein [Planctomycetes bacterium]|nr:carboxypeptidase regulatory-like domain-containing protein [Planctomycetota bacterium]